MCTLTCWARLKRFPHPEQLYGFSPVCVLSCSFKCAFWWKVFTQNLQGNGLSPVCVLRWILSEWGVLYHFPHRSQRSFFSLPRGILRPFELASLRRGLRRTLERKSLSAAGLCKWNGRLVKSCWQKDWGLGSNWHSAFAGQEVNSPLQSTWASPCSSLTVTSSVGSEGTWHVGASLTGCCASSPCCSVLTSSFTWISEDSESSTSWLLFGSSGGNPTVQLVCAPVETAAKHDQKTA